MALQIDPRQYTQAAYNVSRPPGPNYAAMRARGDGGVDLSGMAAQTAAGNARTRQALIDNAGERGRAAGRDAASVAGNALVASASIGGNSARASSALKISRENNAARDRRLKTGTIFATLGTAVGAAGPLLAGKPELGRYAPPPKPTSGGLTRDDLPEPTAYGDGSGQRSGSDAETSTDTPASFDSDAPVYGTPLTAGAVSRLGDLRDRLRTLTGKAADVAVRTAFGSDALAGDPSRGLVDDERMDEWRRRFAAGA